MIKAFIFDFDGLIIDTEYSCYQTWQSIYQSYHVDLPMIEWVKCVGSSNDEFDPIHYLRGKTDKKINDLQLRKQQRAAHEKSSSEMPVLPGIANFIQFAKHNKIKLAVASSSNYEWVSFHLQNKNLFSLFDLIVTSDDVTKVKPAPDLFLKVKHTFGLQDYEGIVFEDSEHGIHAANLAKLYTVAIPNRITESLDLSKANLIMESLAQVTPQELLQTFNNHKKENTH